MWNLGISNSYTMEVWARKKGVIASELYFSCSENVGQNLKPNVRAMRYKKSW